jgi:hypothetical protein
VFVSDKFWFNEAALKPLEAHSHWTRHASRRITRYVLMVYYIKTRHDAFSVNGRYITIPFNNLFDITRDEWSAVMRSVSGTQQGVVSGQSGVYCT